MFLLLEIKPFLAVFYSLFGQVWLINATHGHTLDLQAQAGTGWAMWVTVLQPKPIRGILMERSWTFPGFTIVCFWHLLWSTKLLGTQSAVPGHAVISNGQYSFYTGKAGLTFRMEQEGLWGGISPRALAEEIMRSISRSLSWVGWSYQYIQNLNFNLS